MPGDERILVIKHGALGDWVLATGCFAAIRRHHRSAHVTLLTTPAFADLGARCPWFDEVWTDERPSVLDKPLDWLKLRRRLIGAGFARVYDLQMSNRTGFYFRMLPRRCRPEWSGEVAGCSHPNRHPRRASMHASAVRAEQLGIAGIANVPAPSLDWLDDGHRRVRAVRPVFDDRAQEGRRTAPRSDGRPSATRRSPGSWRSAASRRS